MLLSVNKMNGGKGGGGGVVIAPYIHFARPFTLTVTFVNLVTICVLLYIVGSR